MLSGFCGSLAQGTEPIFCWMAAPSLKISFFATLRLSRDLAAASASRAVNKKAAPFCHNKGAAKALCVSY
jgi:hypothetical protein